MSALSRSDATSLTVHCEFCEREPVWRYTVPGRVNYERLACIKHDAWVMRLVKLDNGGDDTMVWERVTPPQRR